VIRVASVGECMLELTHRDATSLGLGFGGDTLNTALYLARCAGAAGLAVDYVTALGIDPMSEAMLTAWRTEGIGTDQVARLAGRLPGLYLIRTGDSGERRFFYWRGEAAVRALFRGPESEPLLAALPAYDAIYFSGITLAVLAPEARKRFRAALERARASGRQVVFDSNFRPTLWPDRAEAQRVFAEFLATVTLALPTFEDEQALFADADPEATARRYRAAGVGEVVVKRGGQGCLVLTGETPDSIPVSTPVTPVDTTAAGDSFNAGYLAARLLGADPISAAGAGHGLAGAVIRHQGAIIPRAATPTLRELL
jgi:2-dehydro-3-deoxygluconokinase